MDDQMYRASDDVISSKVGDEIVLLHTESDKAFGLDDTAAFIWGLMAHEGKTRDQILNELTNHFDVGIERALSDLDALLVHFIRENLISPEPVQAELSS